MIPLRFIPWIIRVKLLYMVYLKLPSTYIRFLRNGKEPRMICTSHSSSPWWPSYSQSIRSPPESSNLTNSSFRIFWSTDLPNNWNTEYTISFALCDGIAGSWRPYKVRTSFAVLQSVYRKSNSPSLYSSQTKEVRAVGRQRSFGNVPLIIIVQVVENEERRCIKGLYMMFVFLRVSRF